MSGYIDTAVVVNISATSATVSLPGTDIPAILAYHTHNTDKIRTYSDLAGLVTDGFATTDPAYLMATSIVSQNPRPSKFKVIRGTTAVAHVFTFLVTDNTNGDLVGLNILSPLGVATDCHHTVSGETTAQVATAIAALLDALPDSSAAAVGSTVTFTAATAGKVWWVSAINGGTYLETTTTTTPGTDLDAALLIDNSWYGISGEHCDATNILAVAVWAEANKKAHFYTTADTANRSASSGITNTLKAASYKRSVGLFCGCTVATSSSPSTYGGTGWMAICLVAAAGSLNPAYKTIAGTAVDNLTTTDITNIQGNNGNFYINMSGANVTIDGRSAQGLYIDLTIGIDALSADIQTRIGNLLVTTPKLPYTRKGISSVAGQVMAALLDGVGTGFISNDAGFEPAVNVPELNNISAADKSARILKNVVFTCTAQGAINKVTVTGTVTV